MLFLVGLGLGSAKDITVRGLEVVKSAKSVFLESYTSLLTCSPEELETFYGRPITVAGREFMEEGCDDILDRAEKEDIAILVIGDPLCATTHSALIKGARDRKISYEITHNASIISAVASCGLQVYSFGETVSIPFWSDTWKPFSFYHKILKNLEHGLHTLCLLDIKRGEIDYDEMVKTGKKCYKPDRFMSVSQAADQLLECIANESSKVLQESSQCILMARIGTQSQRIASCDLRRAKAVDFGPPLHSLVIVAKKNEIEDEMVNSLADKID